MDLLITGFEPFGGSDINPSQQVVQALDGQVIGGWSVRTAVLPVDRASGPATLLDAIRKVRSCAVLCLGEASRRPAVSVEQVAINLLDFRISDNAGNLVQDEPVIPGGPAAYFATLPVRKIYRAVLDEGIPCECSLTAGTFLCNQVMYTLLHCLAQEFPAVPGGFIHLPALPEQAAKSSVPVPSMSLETSLRAIRAAICAADPAHRIERIPL